MNKLEVSQRDKVRSLYGENPLYRMIERLADQYSLPPYHLKMHPEDIFQAVMGWIDSIRTEPDNEKMIRLIDQSWNRQWRNLSDIGERARCECSDQELEETTCMMLLWLHKCLVLLCDEQVHGNLWYHKCAEKLVLQMMRHSYVWMDVNKTVFKGWNLMETVDELKDWLIQYVDSSATPITTVEGELVLQDTSCFIFPPNDEYDLKMYTPQAQKIWRKLVEKKLCEKQDSMLVWKSTNKSFGFMVKIVAHHLNIYDPTKKDAIAWSAFQKVFTGLEGSTFKQVRNSACQLDLAKKSSSWPKAAQDIRLLVKSV